MIVPILVVLLVFGKTVKLMNALPVCVLSGLVTVMKTELLPTVHSHVSSEALTKTAPSPPAEPILKSEGSTTNEQGAPAAPACLITTVNPATVRTPARAVAPELAATEKLTTPLPLPPPEVMLTNGLLLAAVHAQPSGALTMTLPVPPATANDWLLGGARIEYSQPVAEPPAGCLTLKGNPAMVMVPSRALPLRFGKTW